MTEQKINKQPTKNYHDVWYQSSDGLRLYARDYNNAGINKQNPAILCMHGLTRNSADFADLCDELTESYRLIVAEQRGRGSSEYDPNAQNYNPLTYVQDMFVLLNELNITSVVLLGTSMGGLMAMMMTASNPEMVRGLIINDIGPEVAQAGLDRIKGYVGCSEKVSNWQQAAEQVKSINAVAFPNYTQEQWMNFASLLYREDDNGRPYLAYDSAIAESLNEDKEPEQSAAPDLWPVFELIAAKPMLVIRGALSDILEAECVDKMRAIKADLVAIDIPDVGHAPMLNEAESLSSIKEFLVNLERAG